MDIDIQSEITPQDQEKLGGTSATREDAPSEPKPPQKLQDSESSMKEQTTQEILPQDQSSAATTGSKQSGRFKTLATPAVRHLTKELKVDIADVEGSGKDGRVLKEDVHRHIARSTQDAAPKSPSAQKSTNTEDRTVPLTPVQTAMFKTMTRSLAIPHFLYTSTVDMTPLTALRQKLNQHRTAEEKLSPLPFVLKAISLAFTHHPLLNASLDTTDPKKPLLTYHTSHNFGIAVDTPSGLLVPVIRDIQSQTIGTIATQIRSLGAAAREGKLQQSDMQGATFTVSNIGSIGGGVVAPIIVEPQVAIVGVGRSRIVPAFDDEGELCKKEEVVLSWSADHRVVDGAECARAAERVGRYLERIEEWVLEMR